MRSARTFLFAIAPLLLTIPARSQSSANFARTAMSPAEQRAADALVAAANDDRAPYHLQPLRHDPGLTQAAWRHAQRMVDSGTLSHRLPGEPDLIVRVQNAGVRCSTVAENVAEGPSAHGINDEWMHSPMHRANLLDPRLNAVGVAVVKRRGELYAVEDFAREVRSLTRAQQEAQVASLLHNMGLQVQTGGPVVHAYCDGSSHRQRPLPKLVMRYSTTDLSVLPRQIQQGIRSRSYRRAVVGACPGANENGFAAYQIVVLLY